MKVQVNDCFEPATKFSVAPGIVRVLYLNERYDAVALIQLTDPPRQPIGLSLEELRRSVIADDAVMSRALMRSYPR